MKKHYARYTPDVVSKVTGTPKEAFLKVCAYIAETAAPNKTMTNLYALGWTEHSVGTQNIRSMAIIQQLLGNMGMAGAASTRCAALQRAGHHRHVPVLGHAAGLPGRAAGLRPDRKTYLEKRTPKALRPNQMNFPQNFPKWWTSLMKSFYGKEATAGERLLLRLAAQEGRVLRRAGHV